MKRELVLLLAVFMLTGCSQMKPAVSQPEPEAAPAVTILPTQSLPKAEEPGTPVQTQKTEQMPEIKENPSVETEPEPTPEAGMPVQPKPAPAPEPDWAAYAEEAYVAITSREAFHAKVWQEDESYMDIVIRQGVNDCNITASHNYFEEFEWTQAGMGDWLALIQTEGYGPQLSFYLPGELNFTCYAGSDLVEIADQTKITYLRAAKPTSGEVSSEKTLYDMLDMIPEDALMHQVWAVTVDGTLTPQEAAQAMAEQIAENYRNIPDWVRWRPADVYAGNTEVFDIYWGEPQEFCCDLELRVRFSGEGSNSVYWQAGAGLQDPDEEEYYSYSAQVLARKNAEGNWTFVERGTGGYAVMPQNAEGKPEPEWLVEVFCLTQGYTHDWLAPSSILELSDVEISTLPGILDQLTEAEAKELCAALGKCVRESDSWRWSIDILAPLLGTYGAWLDA